MEDSGAAQCHQQRTLIIVPLTEVAGKFSLVKTKEGGPTQLKPSTHAPLHSSMNTHRHRLTPTTYYGFVLADGFIFGSSWM